MLRTPRTIRFAEYELDPANHQLRRDGSSVKLSPQPFKVLTLLASRPNELVTREELRRAIWGDDVVVDFEHGLNTCIRQVRAALNEDAGEARIIIETIPRVGYRFHADVTERSSLGRQPALVLAALCALVVSLASLLGLDSRRVREGETTSVRLPSAKVGAWYSFRMGA